MKRIFIFCLAVAIIYTLGVVILNLPQKASVTPKETTITLPTPSVTQPTSVQKPKVDL